MYCIVNYCTKNIYEQLKSTGHNFCELIVKKNGKMYRVVKLNRKNHDKLHGII